MQARAGDKQKKRTTPLRQFGAGALAGVIASTVLTPLEVVKTRLQSSKANRLRLDKLLAHVVRTEGVRGLFRGVALNALGVGPARAVHFASYNHFKSFLGDRWGVHGTAQHFFAGAMASTTAATITSPIWVVKTRVQLLTGSFRAGTELSAQDRAYAGPVMAVKSILREEGWRGLFRGLSASYLGVGEAAIQFALYERFRVWYLSNWPHHGDGLPPLASFGLGAAAKLIAASITYPHEVLRTRMREIPPSGSGGKPEFHGIVQSARVILAREGVAGLYGGMLAHMVRTVPNAAILLLVVESVSGSGL